MAKIKTRKTLKKRIRITKNGKILKKHNRIGHLKEKWTSDMRQRGVRQGIQLNKGHVKMFRKLLGE
ncbi:MAG: bL35 family ribosomal protein [Patescibacteria group bacterium]|jgi:ribosomal protein L35